MDKTITYAVKQHITEISIIHLGWRSHVGTFGMVHFISSEWVRIGFGIFQREKIFFTFCTIYYCANTFFLRKKTPKIRKGF